LFLSSILAESDIHLWKDWKAMYNKSYATPQEEKLRLTNFLETILRIQKRASMDPKATGAKFGLTKFADLTVTEFKSKILMKNKITPNRNHGGPKLVQKVGLQIPNKYDWRNLGVVTPVKDQEQCGSCWAFSATETIESAWMLKHNITNMMKPLAPQQIVDCDNSDNGCNGGEPSSAYDYIMSAGGQETNKAYPYTGQDGTCAFQKSLVYSNIVTWDYACHIEMERELLDSTYTYGPLSICVDASNWQDYQSGVMTSWECAWVNVLDHCVQAVGWDLTAPTPYWLVRNSWNTDWGENGFIRLEYGANTCGLTFDATYVTSA